MEYLYKIRKFMIWAMIVLGLSSVASAQVLGQDQPVPQSPMEIFREEMVKNAPGGTWCWADSAATSAELVQKSDLIGIGKVIGSYTEDRFGIVITKNIVEIESAAMLSEEIVTEENYKSLPVSSWPNNKEKEYIAKNGTFLVEVAQNGGFYDYSYTKPPVEAPLLDIGKTYVFFLEYTDEGHYNPVGAYQGVAEIRLGRIRFSEETSSLYPELHNIKSRTLAAEITDLLDVEKLHSVLPDIE